MKLSFVIVTYQRGTLLQTCLDSIYAQQNLPLPYEIILVDNGGDAAVQPPQHPDIHLHIKHPAENLGAAGGRDFGRQHASGDYIIYMDDDAAWQQSDAAARLLAHLDTNPTCGAVCARTVNPETQQTIIAELPHPDKHYALATPQPIEVPYYYSIGCILRTTALDKAGSYPARYFIYMEEVDLSYRIINAGYHILYDPQVGVYHHKSAQGRPIQGADYWRTNALNKSRLAFRLLPHPYPITTLLIWSLWTLIQTRKPGIVLQIWRDLWRERELLRQERNPLSPDRVRYLKRIGARLLY